MPGRRRKSGERNSLGNFLVEQLEGRGKTAAWLAEESGLSPSHISKLINEPDVEPQMSRLVKIADALDVAPRVLFEHVIGRTIEPVSEADREQHLEDLRLRAPWVEPILQDLATMPPDIRDDVVAYMRFRLDQQKARGSDRASQES